MAVLPASCAVALPYAPCVVAEFCASGEKDPSVELNAVPDAAEALILTFSALPLSVPEFFPPLQELSAMSMARAMEMYLQSVISAFFLNLFSNAQS